MASAVFTLKDGGQLTLDSLPFSVSQWDEGTGGIGNSRAINDFRRSIYSALTPSVHTPDEEGRSPVSLGGRENTYIEGWSNGKWVIIDSEQISRVEIQD